MQELISKHTKLIISPLLAVIAAAILFHQNGYVGNGWDGMPLGSSDTADALIFTYLCLLFAAFVKKTDQRAALLTLASITAIFSALPWTLRIFEFRGDFYRITNTDYWHILALTLLTTITCLFVVALAAPYSKFATENVLAFFKSIVSGEHKVLTLILIIPIVILFFSQIVTFIQTFFVDYSSIGDYLYQELTLLIENVATVAIATLGFAYLRPVLVNWLNSALSWMKYLNDFSLGKYLTRRISSALYGVSYVFLTAVIGLGIPVYLYDSIYMQDYLGWLGYLGPILFFPIAALFAGGVWFLSILIIRLSFEFANAIIHIAENTSK